MFSSRLWLSRRPIAAASPTIDWSYKRRSTNRRSVVIPALCIASVNAYKLWTEHWEHKSHEAPKSEQPEYAYQNIRTKNYFWGDGDKVCVFLFPNSNARS